MSESNDDRAKNGWSEWSKYVLQELKRLNDCYESLNKKMDEICKGVEKKIQKNREDIIVLKLKAGLWGLLGGAIPIVIALGVYVIKEVMSK